MTTIMKMIVAGACLTLLAGCGGGGGPGPIAAAAPDVVVPVEVPTVMSADSDENTVTVTRDLATIVVNSLDVDEGTFSVTFGLPDGSSVTLTDEDDLISSDFDFGIGHGGRGIRLVVENDDGDIVGILIGFDLTSDFDFDEEDIAEAIDEAIFVLARVDPDADGRDGVDTYMVTGDETETLPRGSATYHGLTISSVYVDGDLVSDHLTGGAFIEADFANSLVDITLSGHGGGVDFHLTGSDLPIDGSQYDGLLTGSVDNGDEVDLVGDVLGAFFGDAAQATAGVFGVEETLQEALINDRDVEIVGGFAAYTDLAGD